MRLIAKATNPVNAAQSPLSGGTFETVCIIIILQYRAEVVLKKQKTKKNRNTVVFIRGNNSTLAL